MQEDPDPDAQMDREDFWLCLAKEEGELETLRAWALEEAQSLGKDLGAVRVHQVPRTKPFSCLG